MWWDQQAGSAPAAGRVRAEPGVRPANAPALANQAALEDALRPAYADNAEHTLPISLVLIALAGNTPPPDALGAALAAVGRRACDRLIALAPGRFALLLPRTQASGALLLAQRCATIIAAFGGHGPLTAGISVATACAPQCDDNPRELIDLARRLLHAACEDGGDRIVSGSF